MAGERIDLLLQYQSISNKLRKKRILKKPNIAEACQQFEHLAISFEREDLPHYVGLCYQAAAKCQNSLGNFTEEVWLLLKASRQFMSSYAKHTNDRSVPNESYLQHSYMCYTECLGRLKDISLKSKNKSMVEVVTGGIVLEMAGNLSEKCGFIEEGCLQYEKALQFFSKSSVEKIYCLQKIVSSKIELGEYTDSLKIINDVAEEAKLLPDSGLKDDVLRDSEITKIFLLLILQPTPHQISRTAASALEKYAWIDSTNSNDIKNLENKLEKEGLSMLGEDLFLQLQSLVMACQYCDTDCLKSVESDLMPYLNNNQRTLLHVLINGYKT